MRGRARLPAMKLAVFLLTALLLGGCAYRVPVGTGAKYGWIEARVSYVPNLTPSDQYLHQK